MTSGVLLPWYTLFMTSMVYDFQFSSACVVNPLVVQSWFPERAYVGAMLLGWMASAYFDIWVAFEHPLFVMSPTMHMQSTPSSSDKTRKAFCRSVRFSSVDALDGF